MASLLDYLKGGGRKSKDEVPAIVGPADNAGSFSQASSRVSVGGDDGLGIPAYFRAVDIIASTVARLPFRYEKKNTSTGVYEDFEGSPFHYLLGTEPQANMNPFNWMYQLVWQMVHDGDAFVYIRRDMLGDPLEAVLLSRFSCSYQSINHTFTVNDMTNGVCGTFHEDDGHILHFYRNTTDGFNGRGMLYYAQRALDISATAGNETLERFSNGGNVSGIISGQTQGGGAVGGSGRYNSRTMDDLATQLDGQFRSGRRIGALNGDIKFNQFSMSSTDLQFLDTLKHFSVDEIGRMFGIPAYFLGGGGSSQYKGISEAMSVLMSMCIDPILRIIEAEWNRRIVGRQFCCTRRFRFDRRAVWSMDLASMADYQAKTIANGTHTPNDWRKYENQPVTEGGDNVFISANLRNINETTTTPTPQEP